MTADVDALAQAIRAVDGSHSLGAGALAEALIECGAVPDTSGREVSLNGVRLVKHFYLLGHPGWPGGLLIWPSTPERAAEYAERYVGHVPTARITWRWEQEEMEPWAP